MYLAVQAARFTCPVCGQLVEQAVVTAVSTVFTAPAMALHRGVGHTAVLAGSTWVVRCNDSKNLVPATLVVAADKTLRGESPPRKGAAHKG